MLYRALSNLEKGGRIIKRGSVFPASMLGEEVRARLQQLGRIAPASAPPLAALPHWEVRAAKLSKVGIITVEEFLASPDKDLATILKVSPGLVADYKAAVLECLKTPEPQG